MACGCIRTCYEFTFGRFNQLSLRSKVVVTTSLPPVYPIEHANALYYGVNCVHTNQCSARRGIIVMRKKKQVTDSTTADHRLRAFETWEARK